MKTKTIEQLAGKPEGSFKKFLKEKDAFSQGVEAERKTRIRASRKAALDLSWAA